MSQEVIDKKSSSSQVMIPQNQDHYLKEELYRLVREDPLIFDFLQNGSLDGIWYWDLENPDHEWMSPRFWEVFGYDPAEKPHLADAWQDMIHPADLQVAVENFRKHCEDANHPYDQIVRYEHSNGSTVWVRCRGLVVRNHQGVPIRMLGAHTEVTSLKEIEAALQKKTAELERINIELTQTNEDLDYFAFMASHDLQEPLRMISGFLGLLADEKRIDDEGMEYIRFAVDGAARMKKLIQDLLILSRAGKDPKERIIDLNKIIEMIQANLMERIREHDVTILLDEMPTVLGNEVELMQIFQNLVSNSIKYRRKDIKPIIRVGWDKRRGRLFVKDNGQGIPAADIDKVFNPFHRSNQEEPGSGIGLAVCKRVVKKHHGKIWAESVEGEGTTIFFTLGEAH